jgi:hypothetical protein
LHIYTSIIKSIFYLQDCLATIPPYPYYIGDRGADYDVVASIPDPDSMWVVRPQLFFTCTVRPPHATRGRHNKYAEDIALNLVFFSAFEDLGLRTTGTMESNGIRKLYEPSPVPTLYVGRVEDINDWLWNFGRPQPRVGGLSVAKTERIRRKSRSETSRRAWETRKARKMAAEEI